MEEILARLTKIEERLDQMDYVTDGRYEMCESANQRRCDDIDAVRASLRELESTLHYEVSRVRDEVERSGRRW